MTQLENALLIAAKYARAYNFAEPDVGMVPSDATFLNAVMREAGVVMADIDYYGVLRRLETIERSRL